MKLYYAPGACSIGIHILLEEIGKPYELSLVALKEGAQNKPAYQAVNPKSKVPALEIEAGGRVLTEFTAIALYLGLTNPGAGLLPEGPEGVARAVEAVDYVTGTVHPHAFTRQFRPNVYATREEDYPKAVERAQANAEAYFGLIDRQWTGGTYLLPGGFSIADAALFFVTYWQARRVGKALPPRLDAHLKAMLERPAVRRALEQEGMAA